MTPSAVSSRYSSGSSAPLARALGALRDEAQSLGERRLFRHTVTKEVEFEGHSFNVGDKVVPWFASGSRSGTSRNVWGRSQRSRGERSPSRADVEGTR